MGSESGKWGAQLVEALRYTPEGRAFDSRWSYWDFLSLTESFRPYYASWVDSASNINDCQGYLLGVEAAGA